MDVVDRHADRVGHVDAADSVAIEAWAVRLTRRPGWPERSIEAERNCVVLAAAAHLERTGVRVPLGVDHADALGAYLQGADEEARDLLVGRVKVEQYRRDRVRANGGQV